MSALKHPGELLRYVRGVALASAAPAKCAQAADSKGIRHSQADKE